jgi:hypothetical protein
MLSIRNYFYRIGIEWLNYLNMDLSLDYSFVTNKLYINEKFVVFYLV